MGTAAVGVGVGAMLSGAMLSVDAVVVAGSSKEILEKSWETDVTGATTGSGLKDEAGMTNSTRSRCWLSLIEMTIFSRSTGVMCFSPPRILLSVERWRVSSGRAWGASESSSSSDTAESRLEDRSGSGMSAVAACGLKEFAGGERRSGWAQQKVSRFQRRQLRFSRRLPSSIACEVLEKSDH